MCQYKGNNNGNHSGNREQGSPVTESGRDVGGSFEHSGVHNDENGRITTTSQGTNGNPPKQGE